MQLTASPGFRYTEPENDPLPVRLFDIGEKELNAGEIEAAGGTQKAFVEFIWCIGGSGEALLFDHPFLMRENDVFYYLPNEDHYLRGLSERWHLRWVCFDGPLATAVMSSYHYPRLQHATLPCPQKLFEEISVGIGSPSPVERGILAGKLLMILAMANGSQVARLHPDPAIDRVLRFLTPRLADPDLSITMIADQLKIPRSTLLKLFADQVKISLGRYIRNWRYNRALELLRNSELPVNEVATRCGYRESSSFSRLIHRGTGMSPLECRRNRNQPVSLSRDKTSPVPVARETPSAGEESDMKPGSGRN